MTRGAKRNLKLTPHQKVNHIEFADRATRKDTEVGLYNEYHTKFGGEDFDFMPKSFILPVDRKLVEREWENDEQLWILKPPEVVISY